MTGCAGGLSGGLWAEFDATLKPGAALVLDASGFHEALRGAALVITGEGRLDSQTAAGKAVAEVAKRARLAGRLCYGVVGCNDLGPDDARKLGIATVIEAGTIRALFDAGRLIISQGPKGVLDNRESRTESEAAVGR